MAAPDAAANQKGAASPKPFAGAGLGTRGSSTTAVPRHIRRAPSVITMMTPRDGGMRQMDEQEWLAVRFEEHRGRLRAVAYRLLGSTGEADDAVPEAWLRLARAGAGGVRSAERR